MTHCSSPCVGREFNSPRLHMIHEKISRTAFLPHVYDELTLKAERLRQSAAWEQLQSHVARHAGSLSARHLEIIEDLALYHGMPAAMDGLRLAIAGEL